MTEIQAPTSLPPWLAKVSSNRDLLLPIALVALLMVILVPLPTRLIDFLLILNLALSIVILATTVYVKSPLEFAVLPSLLLAVTLFRLVLNVATTRLILTAGDRAPTPDQAIHAAGEMVHAFSSFVTGGSLAVGIIIFIIIFVIQFVVISKGATRISEVAARFTLDAMPGKQMAIDADLNAGIIKEDEARQRRKSIEQEADFYGAMDGASKFVRGDAIAGIIIVVINILGGIYVGMMEHGWGIADVLKLYTKLTIGDGLVSAVPAFIVSLAAGLIITRSSSRKELGDEFIGQMFSKPQALIVAAFGLMMLSLTGLPMIPMFVLAAGFFGIAFVMTRNLKRDESRRIATEQQALLAQKAEPDKVEKLLEVDAMELEIGVGVIPLVDTTRGGDLLDRISNLRRRLAVELGIVVPPVRIRDNRTLGSNDYVVKIRGQQVGKGVTYPEQFLAIDPGSATGPLDYAEPTVEPTFGLPAFWITQSQRPQADLQNYTCVDATDVLVTHLTELIKRHAHELLSRQEVKNLLDNLKLRAPALVDEVIPSQIKPGELQRVMQNLLRERVPVRDLETILETLGDFASRTKDLDVLTEYVRNALARTLCKQYVDQDDKLYCVTLDPSIEELINGHLQRTEQGVMNSMPPTTSQQVVGKIAEKINSASGMGRNPVLLVSPQIRQGVRRMLEGALPNTPVMAYNEVVPEVAAEAVALVTMN